MNRHVPSVPVNFVPAKAGEIIKLGAITCRVMEDGSRTGKHYIHKPSSDDKKLNIASKITGLVAQSSQSPRTLLGHQVTGM